MQENEKMSGNDSARYIVYNVYCETGNPIIVAIIVVVKIYSWPSR